MGETNGESHKEKYDRTGIIIIIIIDIKIVTIETNGESHEEKYDRTGIIIIIIIIIIYIKIVIIWAKQMENLMKKNMIEQVLLLLLLLFFIFIYLFMFLLRFYVFI